MKNFLLTLALVVIAGTVSYGVFYASSRPPAAVRKALADRDAMEWLRTEFKLTDAQFVAIKQLHEDYSARCANHCSAIMAARDRHAPPAEIARLEGICENSMMEHFHKVAALMSPAEGKRYLRIVLPRVAAYDHHGAPTVQVSP